MLMTGALATRSKMPFSSLARIVLIPLGTVRAIPMVHTYEYQYAVEFAVRNNLNSDFQACI